MCVAVALTDSRCRTDPLPSDVAPSGRASVQEKDVGPPTHLPHSVRYPHERRARATQTMKGGAELERLKQ